MCDGGNWHHNAGGELHDQAEIHRLSGSAESGDGVRGHFVRQHRILRIPAIRGRN